MPELTQRSFTGGEISPSLRSRADITKYITGLAKCENMFVRSQGGAYSRPGTKFICEIGDSTKRARLIPFSFNSEQTYILIFEENTMRVIRDGGLVLEDDLVTIFELATPYLEAELPRLSYTQRADVMTIVHPNHGPRNLSRTADNVWTLTLIDFTPNIEPPAFQDSVGFIVTNVTQANPAVVTTSTAHSFVTGDTIRMSGFNIGMVELEGNIYTITYLTPTTFSLDGVDSTGFTAFSDNGGAFRTPLLPRGLGAGDFDKTYEYVITAVDANGEESIASEPQSRETNSLSETAYMLITWSVVPNAAFYNVYKSPSNGSRVYGFIGNSKTTSFEDYNLAPITSDAPPELRDPFTVLTGTIANLSDVNGNPVFTTTAAHGLTSGDIITVTGIVVPSSFNGTYTVEVLSNTTFRYTDFDIAGPFSDYTSGGTFTRAAEFPSTVNYYQQRIVYANTLEQRQTVFTSQTGNFDSLRGSFPARADDAITFSIAAREVNEIRHIVELDAMVLLTSGGTFRVTEGDSQVLTPSTVGVRKQSNVGCNFVLPVIVDSTVIFIQSSGARVRDLNYDFSQDKFGGSDLSIMSEHLFEGFQIEEMAHAEEPYGILWCVRSDGKMLGLTYQREQQVWGWHQHVTDGSFESVATIEEDFRDAPYVIVNRTIGEVTKRYVERMEPRIVTGSEDVWCVDSGLQYSGAAATVISGLDHIEGEAVAVVADGNQVSGLTVTSGAITLPRAATKVTVGLGYTCTMDTLDVDMVAKTTFKDKNINISEVVIEFEDSRGAKCGSLKDDGTADLQEFAPRFDMFDFDSIPLRTSKESVYTEPSWELGGGLRVQQDNPFPMAVLSVIPSVDVS